MRWRGLATTAVKQLETRLGKYVYFSLSQPSSANSSFSSSSLYLSRIAASFSFAQLKVINGVSDWRTRDDGAMKALVFIVSVCERLAVHLHACACVLTLSETSHSIGRDDICAFGDDQCLFIALPNKSEAAEFSSDSDADTSLEDSREKLVAEATARASGAAALGFCNC